uniref:Mitochondrial potassium channel ATP-binding subunit n=4 Tax=Mesocestoides corti TaxID=53468 RepID=A0A5K3ENA5_MESCO
MMYLLYRCTQFLQKSALLRPCQFRYSLFSPRKVGNGIRLHIKQNMRAYTGLTFCAAGAAALFSINSRPLTDSDVPFIQSPKDVLEPLLKEDTITTQIDNNTQVNILSPNIFGSLIVADLPYLFLAVLGAFGAAYFNIRIPILLGDLINVLAQFTHSHSVPVAALKSPSLYLCGAFSLQSLCTFAYIGFLATVGERFASRLRNMLFEHVIFQRIPFFDSLTSGWIIERMTADVQDFKSSFKLCISQGLRSGAQIVGSGIAMYTISPTLTAALMGCLPLVCFVGSLIASQLRRLSHAAHDKSNATTEIATEAFTHIRSVKSLAMEPQMIRQYSDGTSEACRLFEILGYGIGCFQGLSNFAMNGLVLGVLYLGGNLIARGDMDAGQLMAFLVATQAVHRSLIQLSLLFGQVVRGTSAAARISEVLSYPTSSETSAYTRGLGNVLSVDATTHFHFNKSAPSIRFENVTFSYPNRPEAVVFDNLTFEIPAGKVVAIVGESGAGKSTVLSLLERFYEPLAGKITFNGVDIRDFSLSALRGQMIGYISQEPEVFHRTVRENIRCAQPTASDADVVAAACDAQANQFITEQLPSGYDTVVGGGSSSSSAGLSGGQRQRLVIARALVKNAPILLLDEATSALDAESEFLVQSALQNAMSGRTVLIVAHRLSTIRRADLIMVMHKGRIVEQGTHEELIRKRSRYYDLLQRQGTDD